MKVFNLPRGRGKTMRMLYASEFNNIPILCCTETHKNHLIEQAERFGINIPEPITVGRFIELRGRRFIYKEMLIDEMDAVLSTLMLQGFGTEVKGATITTDNGGKNGLQRM